MIEGEAPSFIHPWVLPDIIIENDGVSCGDRITLYVSIIGEAVHVGTATCGCLVCRTESDRMKREVSGRSLADVREFVQDMAERGAASRHPGRGGCASLPWESLVHAFERLQPATCFSERDGFGCDACVTSYRPTWNPEPTAARTMPGTLRLLWSGLRRLDHQGQAAQRFGRMYAPVPRDEFQTFAEALRPDDMRWLKRLRLAAPLYNAAIRDGVDSVALRPLLATALAQSVRQSAIAGERERILDIIATRRLAISPVKGTANAGLYPKDWVRPSLDFDFVAHSFEAAMELAHELVVGRGYRFVVHGSVPFSIKLVADDRGIDRVIGHFHVEAFIGGRHQVVVDISFPGYPIGKSALLDFSGLEPGQTAPLLPLIALLHMFKHEHAFAKDANDLHLLIEDTAFDEEDFLVRVMDLDLGFIAGLALRHLGTHGERARRAWERMRSSLSPRDCIVIELLLASGWPDRAAAHFAGRIFDLWRRIRRSAPLLVAATILARQLRPAQKVDGVPGGALDALRIPRNARCYLVPLAIFRRYPGEAWRPAEMLAKRQLSCTELGQRGLFAVSNGPDQVVLTTLGIFAPTGDWFLRGTKEGLARLTEQVLASLELGEGDLHLEALGIAKPHLWLY